MAEGAIGDLIIDRFAFRRSGQFHFFAGSAGIARALRVL
jgi:hypothetical protein